MQVNSDPSKMSSLNRKRKSTTDSTPESLTKTRHRQLSSGTENVTEEHLSQILFGSPGSILQSLQEVEMEVNRGRLADSGDSGLGDSDTECSQEKKPAWTDDEDDGIEVGQALDVQRRKLPRGGLNGRMCKYERLLRSKFVAAYGSPEWAKMKVEKEGDDDDVDVVRKTGFVKDWKDERCPSGNLVVKKMKDLNDGSRCEGNVTCVEFNRAASVALVAGSSGAASFHAVDGKSNEKLHSVGFLKYPIVCGRFYKNGNEAVFGSNHSYGYTYDLLAGKSLRFQLPSGMKYLQKFEISPDEKFMAVAGNYGEIHLLLASSKEKIATLKQHFDVSSLAFDPNNSLLYSHSTWSEITVWNLNTRRVLHKWTDDGCVTGTTLTISPSNQFVATGSAEGVVNLYETTDVLKQAEPKPKKTLYNIITKITNLKFNSSSEILGFSSPEISNSVKLYHVASGSVFSNFPNSINRLGNVSVLNFSPNSGFVAFGNKKSCVSLYRLKHFNNY